MKRALAVAALIGCGPAGPSAEPSPATQAPPPVIEPVPPVAPSPRPIAAEPPVAGTLGTAGFVSVLAAAPSGAWIVVCQARADTDKDGSIRVQSGHHGELFGDELAPYWIRGAGAGEELEAFIAADPTSRWLVTTRRGSMQLIDTTTGAATDLGKLRADARYSEANLFDGARAAFDDAGAHLLYVRRPARKRDRIRIVVRELATGREREIDPGPGTIRRIQIEGAWLSIHARVFRPGHIDQAYVGPSGPDHTVGGERCRRQHAHPFVNTERRLVSLAGGKTIERADVVAPLGDALIVRAASGELVRERDGGKATAIAPADCGGVVIARSHRHASALIACPARGTPAPVLFAGPAGSRDLGIATDSPSADEDYRVAIWDLAAIGAGDRRWAVDLARGTAVTTDAGNWLARHDRRLLGQRGGDLVVLDLDTDRAAPLGVRVGNYTLEAQTGGWVAVGTQSAETPGALVDLTTGVAAGRFDREPLAVSDGGWVLTPVDPPAAYAERVPGPLEWQRPRAIATAGD